MRIPTTVNVLGWNGTGEPPDIQDIWRQIVLPQMRAEFPDFKESDLSVEGHPMRRLGTDRVCELLHAWFIAKEHNDTVPKLTAYVRKSRLAEAAIRYVAGLYDDLSRSTTVNWLAAHHTFVLATGQARRLLADRVDQARALHARTQDQLGVCLFRPSLTREFYEKLVPAEYRITLPDADADQRALDEFVELSTDRFRTLRATITGAFPPGFEPAPVDPAGAGDEVAAEWAGQRVPVSPALVLADRGSRP